jgi:hypothetical protein
MSKKILRVDIWADKLHHIDGRIEPILKIQKDKKGFWVFHSEYTKLENKLKKLEKKLKSK